MFQSSVYNETWWPIFKVRLSYKLPSSWRELLQSGERPRQFSCLTIFRSLVVPDRGFCKGIILQLIMTPTGVLPNGQSFLKRNVDVTGASVHAPKQRNSKYVNISKRYIYDTIRPKHPYFPINRYNQRPLGTTPWPHYKTCNHNIWHVTQLWQPIQ